MAANAADAKAANETPAIPGIQKILETAKSVRTPIQLASVAIALVFIVVLSRANIAVEAVHLVLALLPFILIFLIFNGKTLDRIKAGGIAVAILLLVCVLGSFVPAILIAVSALYVGQSGIINSSANVFSNPARQKRAEKAYNDDVRVRSYLDNYNLTSSYYSKALHASFESPQGDSIAELLSLRKQMDEMQQQIIAAKSGALENIYGSEGLKTEILKFEKCQLDLRSMTHLWSIVMLAYGSKGETKTLDQILDPKSLPSDPVLRASIPRIRYSQVESDLISALGPAFVTKTVNGFNESDVDRIRLAFSSLGYLGAGSNGGTSAEILRRFNLSLAQYLDPQQLDTPMYRLAYESPAEQVAIYIALYDTGLLDFKRFVLKYSPEQVRPAVNDLLSREITLVNSRDFDSLTKLLIQQERPADKDLASPSTILFNLRDEFKANAGNDPAVQQVLESKTAEEFLIQSLRVSMNKQHSPATRAFFGGIGGFGLQVPGRYDSIVQDELSYYDVFESTVIAGALAV
jgi:hypothetical protein